MRQTRSQALWHAVRWLPVSRLRPPPQMRAWLLDQGSLTAHLQRSGAFRVQVLSHGWQRPSEEERLRLRLRPRSAALVREVLLLGDGVPRVYARSVLPAAALRGRQRHLRRFGARSLGAHLFRRGQPRREPFELLRLPAGSRLPGMGAPAPAPLWGRRSAFYPGARPLLVAEIFLPAFQPWTEPSRQPWTEQSWQPWTEPSRQPWTEQPWTEVH